MRVCIVGCGAVGSLFAANLASLDDVEVWAYDSYEEHVAAINEHGLRLSGAGEVVGRLRATSDRFRSSPVPIILTAPNPASTPNCSSCSARPLATSCTRRTRSTVW